MSSVVLDVLAGPLELRMEPETPKERHVDEGGRVRVTCTAIQVFLILLHTKKRASFSAAVLLVPTVKTF